MKMVNENVRDLKFEVSLNTIDKVKDFATLTTKQAFDIDLVSGRYLVDAKSIMGIFSMDLSKPITCIIHEDAVKADAFIAALKDKFTI